MMKLQQIPHKINVPIAIINHRIINTTSSITIPDEIVHFPTFYDDNYYHYILNV